MREINIFRFFLLFNIAITSSCFATLYDRPYVENLAKEYLMTQWPNSGDKKVEIFVSEIDPRIEIKPCDSTLQVNIPDNHNGRNVNVKISCEDSTSWSIFLPAKIEIQSPILVSLMPIDKGSILTEENTQVVYYDESMIRGETYNSNDLVLGSKAKRNIGKDVAITPRNICLVCKGDTVTLMAQSSTLTIKTSGEALSNGHIGDKVRVKNLRSGKTVSGVVSAVNQVLINF